MKLNHLSLAVPDVMETGAFMEKFFSFTPVVNKGNLILVMEGTDTFALVLTTQKDDDGPYPADFHFGFFLEDQNQVLHKYEQLLAAGYDIARAPARIRSSFGFYFNIPGAVMMEVSCNL